MTRPTNKPSILCRLQAIIGWTPASSFLIGGFLLVCGLIVYIWWPLAKEALTYIDWSDAWWLTIDWLLIGIFTFMSLSIITRANIKYDGLIVIVGMCGGLVIEAWGTQTNLWHYFTAERPPIWILPAWPIASLSIDRITRFLIWGMTEISKKAFIDKKFENMKLLHARRKKWPPTFKLMYYLLFYTFFGLMFYFVEPFTKKPTTIMALLLVVLVIVTVKDYRKAILIFVAGSGLGYFLELWGTSRQCWTYYTCQTPPLFAVLAHGMAAVAFWHAGQMTYLVWNKLIGYIFNKYLRFPNPGIKR